MRKIFDFGRKAMFYIRVLSGYEERRIRSYRLQLQERLNKAQAKKEALKTVPEQIILSEVRKMVQDMQAMNKRLEETEAVFEEYFKPIDKEAAMIVKMQLDGEEENMKNMMKAMQQQALLDRAEAVKPAELQSQDGKPQVLDQSPDLKNNGEKLSMQEQLLANSSPTDAR